MFGLFIIIYLLNCTYKCKIILKFKKKCVGEVGNPKAL